MYVLKDDRKMAYQKSNLQGKFTAWKKHDGKHMMKLIIMKIVSTTRMVRMMNMINIAHSTHTIKHQHYILLMIMKMILILSLFLSRSIAMTM